MRRKWFSFILVTCILYASFATGASLKGMSSMLHISDPTGELTMADAYETFQADSDLIVYSSLHYYRLYGGVYSGMWQRPTPENPKDRLTMIKEEYGKTAAVEQAGFTRYASSSGFQGLFWGAIDKVMPISNAQKVVLFEQIACLLSALCITYVLFWLMDIAGAGAVVISVLWLALGSFFTISMAGSVYWMFFTWWLPMIAVIHCFKHGKSTLQLCGLVFLTLLMRCLCGYEYISTIMIAMTVPLFYYCVVEQWGIGDLLIRFLQLVGAAMVAFVTSIVIYFIQYTAALGSFSNAYAQLQYTILRRCAANSEQLLDSTTIKTSKKIVEALNVSVFDVLKEYFWGKLGPLRFGYLVIIIVIFTFLAILLNRRCYRIRREEVRTLNGLCLATFVSLLAPLSWFVLCKAHAHIHTHISYVLWDVPYLLLGIALCWKTVVVGYGFMKKSRRYRSW